MPPKQISVAVVAPSMGILGGQAVQADRLLEAWANDADIKAWLVPINPQPPSWLAWATRVKYLRTVVTQMLYWPLLLRELRKADVVHVFSASYFSFMLAPLPAILIARLLGRPILLNYRSGEAPDHLSRSAIARRAIAGVTRNVVPSTFLQDVFASFGIRADIIPNIVDVDRFRFRLREPIRPVLVSTRNFEGLYNVACTLRAFAIVQGEYPDATLTLVGSGSLEAALKDLARELDLRDVTFAGRVAPSDIWRYYADADIYVQTPDIDNMPSSVLEAYSSGTPVVSTLAGGVPAILTDGVDGLLAPIGDHVTIAKLVLRLLRDPELAVRLSLAARDRCNQYVWPRVRNQWVGVYRELAAKSAREVEDSRLRRVPSGTIARLRAMDRNEIRFRARAAAVRAARRLGSLVRPARWRRASLIGLLHRTAALAPTLEALRTRDWQTAHEELSLHFSRRSSRFVIAPSDRAAIRSAVAAAFPAAAQSSTQLAEKLVSGSYDLLGYSDLRFDRGTGVVDWSYDPVHDAKAPSRWWSSVRYLDPRYGDHKIIWELNRHQHWLALGRAYWLTGDDKYRARFISEFGTWMPANRPLLGINWASMLELSVRGLSWVWALHFFADPDKAKTDETPWTVDLLLGLDRQMRHVEENLSRYFSPNTHLTGEALGLYVVGRVVPELAHSTRWEEIGRRILVEEAGRQVASDGGHAERSTHYHRYTLDFYLLALAVARKTGDKEAERAFARVAAKLARFALAMADSTGHLPRIGDDDAGQLLPMCGVQSSNVGPSLAIAAALLDELSGDQFPDATEEALWLSGTTPEIGIRPPATERLNRSSAFPESGFYVMRSASGDGAIFDAGPQGYLNAGHGHADALAICLSVAGHPFLIDPGTGTYTMDPSTRDRFRSTHLHNTVVIDGRSQAEPRGPFHWRQLADAALVTWASNERFDAAEGFHEAYSPTTHRRAVIRGIDVWLIADHIFVPDPTANSSASSEHEAAVHWHLDPKWKTRLEAPNVECTLENNVHVALATTAPRLDIFHADPASGLGFCSPAYGQVVPCTAIRFSETAKAPFSVITAIVPGARAGEVRIEAVAVSSHDDDYAAAAMICRPNASDMVLFATGPARRQLRRFGGFETDARFAHIRLSETGAVQAVALVDVTVLRQTSSSGFSITLDSRVHDLAASVETQGGVSLFSSNGVPAAFIHLPNVTASFVRTNGVESVFVQHPDGIAVEATGAPAAIVGAQADIPVQAR